MAALPLIGNYLNREEMEHRGKVGHNIGKIQQIYPMIRIEICYTTCHL